VIFRSHYGWQSRGNPLLDSKGHDISVLYSVAHAVLAVMELESVTHLAVCFDAKGKTFRHEMFADYKANRPATPPEIKKAIPEVITMLKQMNIPTLTLAGVEADDIIGTVAHRAVAELGFRVSIISPDKDFFQLLGPRVRQLRPNGKNFVDSEGVIVQRPNDDAFADYHEPNLSGKGLVPYTESDFRNEFDDLDPAQFVDVLAMVGDASDNVPGVEGVGPKTAPRLLKLYGNIEGCVENAQTTNDIKNKRVRENLKSPKGAASAYLCRNLVKIRTELNAPTLASPALTFEGPGSLELRHRVPPEDEGAAIGEYLERGLELGSAADRWRDLCRKRGGRSSG
jgi:5'-3' exonuclease